MSKHAHARRSSPWVPLAAAAVGGALLLASGAGVWAGLSARTSSAPQAAGSGTLSLTLAANGAGFTQPVSALAPGDTVHRYVTLAQAGTIAGQQLTLSLASSTSTLLTGTDARSLRLSVASCSGTWTPATGACSGTTSVLVSPTTTVASAIAAPVTVVAGVLATSTPLRVSLLLPDNDEVTTNGVPPASTVQGLSTSLTWTFAVQQRTATTTSS
jgi:hypothetical protein